MKQEDNSSDVNNGQKEKTMIYFEFNIISKKLNIIAKKLSSSGSVHL